MAGYNNYSKSNNAIWAEQNGEMNATNFAKHLAKLYSCLRGCTAGDIKAANITPSSWHHTSCKYNTTDYYDVDMLDESSIARLANTITARKGFKKWIKEGKFVAGQTFYVIQRGEEWHPVTIGEKRHITAVNYFRLYQQFAGRYELEDMWSWSSAETKQMYKEAGLLTEEEIEIIE